MGAHPGAGRRRDAEETFAESAGEAVAEPGEPDGKCVGEAAPASEEGQPARGVRQPNQPTAGELRQHRLTHLPYRPWCLDCVRGQGRDHPHERTDRSDSTVPMVCLSEFFVRNEEEESTQPVLAVMDDNTRV